MPTYDCRCILHSDQLLLCNVQRITHSIAIGPLQLCHCHHEVVVSVEDFVVSCNAGSSVACLNLQGRDTRG